ncbi:hypothetical protein [Desemzia sp. FAM 23991]|uniref:hypothetical protein n=1 Tax=unclassified Desemzia TaxID=2685243 RepID=UPI00388B4ECD
MKTKLKLIIISFFSIVTMSLTPIPVMGAEIDSPELSQELVGTEEFDIRDDFYSEVIETEKGTLTITVEDTEDQLIAPFATWPNGSYSKKVSANFTGTQGASWFGTMTATFRVNLSPYNANILGVSNGEFNASVISPTGEKYYEVLTPHVTGNSRYAEARYREKYNIAGFGQHDMCLYLQLRGDGHARAFMRGIW